MNRKMPNIGFLLLSAFIEGSALMAVEILSSKIIAPYYGSSLYVWASIIGVTMGGLAIGYFLGGVFSEKKINTTNKLMILFVISSLLLFLMPYISFWIMNSTLHLEIRTGIFLSCFVFMLPPIICFGMVSPILIRLLTSNAERIGASSGIIYTISTLGGIIFTFFTGFYLISSFGVIGTSRIISTFLLLPPLFHFVKVMLFRNKNMQSDEK